MEDKKEFTLIKSAKIMDGESMTSFHRDILIQNDTIVAMQAEIRQTESQKEATEVYPAQSRVVTASFIDTHCHLRDPGFLQKEDIFTGTQAAVAGGYGAIVCMPNTKPVTDSPEILDYILQKAKKAGNCAVFPTAAITEGQQGERICNFELLTEHGAIAFTDDGKPVSNAAVMREAMKRCAVNDYLIISHCEDLSLAKDGCINEGKVSRLLGVKGIPNAAEDVMIARDIVLAEETGCRLHIAHVSTKGGLQLIREAKKRGVRVTCETCPHYFSFSEEDVVFYGVNAKMNPPLRSQADVTAVIEALQDGTIDCISTDHAPHTEEEKGTHVAAGAFGILGLQTAFSAGMTYLVMPGHIDIYRLLTLLTIAPAKILGLDKKGYGKLQVGKKAKLTILSLDEERTLSKNMIHSKSWNTPYLGLSLCGTVDGIFLDGKWIALKPTK